MRNKCLQRSLILTPPWLQIAPVKDETENVIDVKWRVFAEIPNSLKKQMNYKYVYRVLGRGKNAAY